MFRMSYFIVLVLVCVNALYAQTSENSPRLKQGLTRYPDADTNKDGVLTVAEAQAYLAKNPEVRQKLGNGGGQAQTPIGGEKHVYKKVGKVELSLYVFAPAGHVASDNRPAAVFFFGGGWTSGSPNQFELQCQYLAELGMIGITVDYRVSSRHAAKIEDCVEDAKSAMRWVRSNAARLGIDPNRIASGGGSAGGHLAACTAVIEGLNAATDDLEVSPTPNAMLLFNPALMIAPDKRMSPQELRQADGAANRARTSMANVSPLNFASAKQPPMIMFFGTEDKLLKGAEFYKQDSEKVGNSCKLVTYAGQDHGFFNSKKYRELTMQEMDKFLVELGWLPSVVSR